MQSRLFRMLVGLALIAASGIAAAQDPLPSWNDGPTKSAIVAFVEKVTAANSPAYLPPAERIAAFDHDGTLWSEQPLYFQGYFALAQIRDRAADHPDWNTIWVKSIPVPGCLAVAAH